MSDRRAAIELTLHQLQATGIPTVYDVISGLCPRGVHDLLPLTVHLAEACGALLERETGSRDAAIVSLQQQLSEERG